MFMLASSCLTCNIPEAAFGIDLLPVIMKDGRVYKNSLR